MIFHCFWLNTSNNSIKPNDESNPTFTWISTNDDIDSLMQERLNTEVTSFLH